MSIWFFGVWSLMLMKWTICTNVSSHSLKTHAQTKQVDGAFVTEKNNRIMSKRAFIELYTCIHPGHPAAKFLLKKPKSVSLSKDLQIRCRKIKPAYNIILNSSKNKEIQPSLRPEENQFRLISKQIIKSVSALFWERKWMMKNNNERGSYSSTWEWG